MKMQRGILMTLSVTALLGLALTVGMAAADDDERGEYGERGESPMYREGGSYRADGDMGAGMATAAPVRRDVMPVANPLYQESCGGCHIAYQPGLLPARSWDRIMNGLADHFGENAELLPEDQKAVSDYLAANAADVSDAKRSRRIAQSIAPDEAPLRISETAYFKREHRELKPRMVQDNPEVRSFSNCGACHTRAAEGSFREREVVIPGFGRYDD